MLHLRSVHDSGTEALITQQQNGWQIQINLREPNRNPTTVTGFLVPTVERLNTLRTRKSLSMATFATVGAKNGENSCPTEL